MVTMRFKTEKIENIKIKKVKEKAYNFTTTTGNLIVSDILCSNSGGLGTPPHERVEAGLIHKSHNGVFIY